jgi:hypothetical protein
VTKTRKKIKKTTKQNIPLTMYKNKFLGSLYDIKIMTDIYSMSTLLPVT